MIARPLRSYSPEGPETRTPSTFFFQAEDGIRDHCVTGVQTCALPISRLAQAFAMLNKLNGAAESVVKFAAAIVNAAECQSIKQMLRSKYEIEQWLDISKEIQDQLRERKRDSLVAYLLKQPMPLDAPTSKWENTNDLYAYY